VYCIVPAALALTDAPGGLNDAPIRSVARSDIAALVSTVPAADYATAAASQRMDDPQWLAPRAIAHDAVVTWAADRGAVIPFPMWVMFSNEAAVSSTLEKRHDEFRATLDRVSGARELCVRVAADRLALMNAAERMDAGLADLERQAGLASPGQAYLLRRKLAEARKSAARDVASRIVEQTHATLTERSRDSIARATAATDEPGVILDAAYLVADDGYQAFREALTGLVTTYEPAGLRFDFTGPWPPYHFVRGN